MVNKRQVMHDLERCVRHEPDACEDCSHCYTTTGFDCMEKLMSDALALLKEQEAVEPIKVDSDGYWYCRLCGEKVKWDD